jgi:molybdopterin-guanine dinucleotide biosynthesis protein A
MRGGYHAVMVAVAGVVLAGGRSTRMGTSKAALEWHGSTLVRRVAGIVARSVNGPMFVVAAPGQCLPTLPPEIAVVADPREGRGPLQGLAVGLAAAADVPAAVAFVCSTDMPLLHPAVVRRVVAGLHHSVDVALPVVHGRRQPLVAAYRTTLAGPVANWVGGGERRMTVVAERSRVNVLQSRDLLADAAVRAADPELLSLSNLNTPQDYRAARTRPAPPVTVRSGDRAERVVHAATVAGAAAAMGLTFGQGTAVLDGVIITDGTTPLVAGDVVTFRGDGG